MTRAYRSWTEEDLINAVANSTSMSQVCLKLGLSDAGGTKDNLFKHINRLSLNTSHWLGKGWLKGKTHSFDSKPLEELLKENTKYTSFTKVRERIIREGLWERKCQNCDLTDWMGTLIMLEVHHINGDRTDNRFENLQLLCCNCHAMTDNYRGRSSRDKENKIELMPPHLCVCGKEISDRRFKQCIDCYNANRPKGSNVSTGFNYPEDSKLIEMIHLQNNNLTHISKDLGVSRTALRKYLKRKGLYQENK